MEKLYEGKSKIVYAGPDEWTCYIKYKDTATAGNGAKKEDLPEKGRINAKISNIIYEYLSKYGIKTHMLRVVEPTMILARKAEIVPLEVVVRNVAAGHFSSRFGVEEGTPLKNVVVEFSYKNDDLGDPLITDSMITALGLAEQQEIDYIKDQALKINELLVRFFDKAGIKLIDFKIEFGRCDGEIILCDEISPDCARLWDKATNEKMDKDRFRRDMGDVMYYYEEILRRVMKANE